jgi:acyl carrier protein
MIATDALTQQARAVVARHFRRPVDEVRLETRFVEDLGADSLDMVELAHALEEALDVTLPEGDLEAIRTLADVLAAAARAGS